jgi:putative hemolysin
MERHLSPKFDTLSENHPARRRFVRRQLTWAESFDRPALQKMVQIIEYLSGKHIALRLMREYERRPAPVGSEFWSTVRDVMGIEILTPACQVANIPKHGPLMVVANHPTGPLDGIVLAEIVRRVRDDYKILTRDLMTVMETDFGEYLIAVPFWHSANALQEGLRMREKAFAHLSAGGALAYFPSGAVATSDGWFGPPVEAKWNVFTAKMIRNSGATVIPVKFHGGPSRIYQIGNKISPVIRQGLLIHEIVRQRGRSQSPIVGTPLQPRDYEKWANKPREFMVWLRNHTLSLNE